MIWFICIAYSCFKNNLGVLKYFQKFLYKFIKFKTDLLAVKNLITLAFALGSIQAEQVASGIIKCKMDAEDIRFRYSCF